MHILCNGKQQTINDSTTLQELLQELKLDPDSTVAEINTRIINREQYESTTLAEGDELELIRFVGGG